MSTRAEQRRLRQLEIEDEQRLEDAEALKMTEEQRDILLRTFHSVKFEFRDLDGLSWTDPIRQQLKQPEGVANAVNPYQDQQQPQQPPFVVLTKAELAAFSPEETIRISTVHRSCFPQHEAEPPIYNDHFVTPVLRRGKRDGTRARSPIKGLFSTASDASTNSDHCSNRHVYDRSIIVEAVLSKTDEQATIRLRDSPVAVAGTAVTALNHLAGDSRSHSPTSPTLCTNALPVSPALCTSPRMQPPPRPTTTTASPTGAGIITSIFRSPVFSVPKGRMGSQVQCSVVSTPKSSPSLASICSFSSP
ncbi:hypothetical protein JOM56_005394 [Amanita muscaria]